MDVLAGRLRHQSQVTIDAGEVLVNNAPIQLQRFRHSVGYLTQDDYLPPTETVRSIEEPPSLLVSDSHSSLPCTGIL
jgi:ABC-type multidrug transport system ATPase subunit